MSKEITTSTKTLLIIADRFPPCLVRFCARKNKGMTPMGNREIAERAGLSKDTVRLLSVRSTWAGVSVDVIDRFTRACGVNILNPRATLKFLRNGKKHHLTQLNATQRKFFQKLVQT